MFHILQNTCRMDTVVISRASSLTLSFDDKYFFHRSLEVPEEAEQLSVRPGLLSQYLWRY